MLVLLDFWRQEAHSLYRQVPDGEDVSAGEKHSLNQAASLQFLVRKIYQVAPFLLLLNLVFAAAWTVEGLSQIFRRPGNFAPDRKINKPLVSITTTTFEENATFVAPPSRENNAAWEALRPKGGGAIVVPNAKAYGLKPGIPMETGPDVYGISMFHQLHCLTLLRASYYAALNGTLLAFPHKVIEILPKERRLLIQRGHVAHCFDYIRQGIMCAGDLTVESAVDLPEEWLEGVDEELFREAYGEHKPRLVDGWGIKHQCRNFEEAWDWTFRNRVPDDSGVEL